MKKKCILYGNCQDIIYVYELLNNLHEFKKHYDLIINKIIDDPEKFIDMPF